MKNIWNIISAIAGLLAVAIAIYVFIQGREGQSKKLEVELISSSTLVNTKLSNRGDKIEIHYDGQKIKNFSILQFRISNSGSQPVRSTDYESPIKLKLSNISSVLSVERTVSDPPSLPIETNISTNSIVISETLLNPGDWFTIEVGVIPIPQKTLAVEVTGRIAGVKRVDFKDMVSAPKEGKGILNEYLLIIQSVLVLIMVLMQIFMKRWFLKRE